MTGGAPTIEQIKLTYRIPAAWRDLDLDGEPGKSVCSPFRPDRNPSFSVHDDGRRWRDFGTNESGDVIDFVAHALGSDVAKAVVWIQARLGFRAAGAGAGDSKPRTKRKIPELRFSAPEECRLLNVQRGFS